MHESAQAILVISAVNVSRLKLVQEREASKKVIRYALRTIWIICVPTRSCSQRGHVCEVSKMQCRVGSIGTTELEDGIGCSWVSQMTMST
jgi:hypothetical protein